MVDIELVACWFLSKRSMSLYALQVLCFYSNAWCLCFSDKQRLFVDDAFVGCTGPFYDVLRQKYYHCRFDIPREQDLDYSLFPEDVVELLELVYSTYGEFSDFELEYSVCSERPWITARGNCKPWEFDNNIISVDCMYKFYRARYDCHVKGCNCF